MNTSTNHSGSEIQSKILKQIQELGDALERAGEKIERKGWESIGQAIYKLGDSLEHLNEKFGKSDKSKVGSAAGASATSYDASRGDFSSDGLGSSSVSGSSVGSTGSSSYSSGDGTNLGTSGSTSAASYGSSGSNMGSTSGSSYASTSGSSLGSETGSDSLGVSSDQDRPLGASRADSFSDADSAITGNETVSSTGSERQSNQSFTKNPTSVNPDSKSKPDSQGTRAH